MQWFAEKIPFGDAIRRAAFSEMRPEKGAARGKRHPHQYRISRAVLERAATKLRAQSGKLRKAANFDALHQSVDHAIGSLKGIGPLACYDIAHRLGARRGLALEKVYLHSGTLTGARNLGLVKRGQRTFEIGDLPTEFRKLSAAEIEDCLCIYKDCLAKFRR